MSRKIIASVFTMVSMFALCATAMAAPMDSSLSQKVRQSIGHNSAVSVYADDTGSVYLSGGVDTLKEKQDLIASAKNIEGVTAVRDGIVINGGS